jgi:hypothetical protein
MSFVIEGGGFAGAAAGHDAVSTVFDLKFHQPAEALLVKSAVGKEGGDDGHQGSSEHDFSSRFIPKLAVPKG